MLEYAICEIAGKQYKFTPNKPLEVALQTSEGKNIEINVLMTAESGKVKIGTPYLQEKITLERVEDLNGKKVRVARFHAKANYRRVTGMRPKLTKVLLRA